MEFHLAADLECDLTVFHPTAPKEVSRGGWEQITARATGNQEVASSSSRRMQACMVSVLLGVRQS